MTVHILLPAYNEAGALPQLLERIAAVAPTWGCAWRVTVLDDGSSDATAEQALRFAAPWAVEVVSHPTNRGLAAALRTGIAHICARADKEDVLVTLDADNTHDPALIGEMLAHLRNGADIVLASRFLPGGKEYGVPLLRRLLSHGVRWLLGVLFPIPGAREYSCSFRAVRVALYQRALATYGKNFIRSTTFAATPEILLRLRRFPLRVAEVPLVLRYDQKVGGSKMRVAPTLWGYFQLIGRCWRE